MEEEGHEGGGESRGRVSLCIYFPEPSLERLYQSYRLKQKRGGVAVFVIAALLLDAWAALSARGAPALWSGAIGVAIALALGVVEIVRGRCAPCKFIGGRVASVIACFATAFFLPAAPPVLCPLLVVYLLLAALPLRLRYCLLLALLVSVLHGLAVQFFTVHTENLVQQHIGNGILLAVAAALGLLAFLLDDRQQRQAFLETRQSLEVKLVIEEQSAEQERLLLSVLPEHVAVKMRQDLGSTDTQFKKIYMSRHENVSILYADIVGFTAISSTYSAQDLVAILNELFARFDRLADKYQQLRIKILGDCYYCISGAPVEIPDHAGLCVRMGLAMVKSIKYLQQTTNSPVDMRVGIHTGAILAGVLGQRQWQFDVYSKDVELANKMESSGNAGRVHISEKTLSFLDGEFEVEPAYGEKREEALRLAGIKTYFIVKPLRPFQPSLKDADKTDESGVCKANNVAESAEETAEVLADVPSDTRDEGDSMKSPVEEEKEVPGNDKKDDSDEFNDRLRKELVNRDGNKLLAKHTGILLGFQTHEMEMGYSKRDGMGLAAGVPLAAAAVLPVAVIATTLVIVSYYQGAIPLVASIITPLIVIASPFLTSHSKRWKRMSVLGKRISDSPDLRLLAVYTTVALLTTHNGVQMWLCAQSAEKENSCNDGAGCAFIGCSGGALIAAIGALSPVPLFARAVLAILAITPPAALTFCFLGDLLDCWDNVPAEEALCIPTKISLTILMIIIALTLIILSYQLEATSRVLFLWKAQIEKQRECAADMRRRNEALVYNVLPPHVAAHFMGNRRRQHNELYSQSYSEVGVLFASMPNFSEFYTEETVNNQGLECLRFLNEVISDFDALIEKPPYQDIIKIKTIGSSYMAATGLNLSRQVKADDPITVRWFHLSLLVEFALELTRVLQGINEQSFNHFVLKMGINHGPITAGVIGARKPHYDIWGNTVNVASRMESTGKAGCIQVTEDTCNILKNFGYTFEQRGLVTVKGKGQLMTYYLLGKNGCEKSVDVVIEKVVVEEPVKVENHISEIDVITSAQSPSNGSVPKSPNSNATNCNGVLPLSPSNKEAHPPPSYEKVSEGDEKFKLLTQEDSSNDLNIDARESDALLKK